MRRNRMLGYAVAGSAVLFGFAPNAKAVIYVNQNATGANTGGSWVNAFTDLQPALTAAPPFSEVWVARGKYLPGTATTDTFTLPDKVFVLGGFNGTETIESQRDPATNVTTLSGELGSPGLADNCEVIVNAYSVGVGEGAVDIRPPGRRTRISHRRSCRQRRQRKDN